MQFVPLTTRLIDDPDVIVPPMFAKICLYGDKIGRVNRCGEIDGIMMHLFFDSMNRQALGYLEDCFIYTKFHGDNNAVAKGIEYCEDERVSFRGIKTDWSNCDCP